MTTLESVLKRCIINTDNGQLPASGITTQALTQMLQRINALRVVIKERIKHVISQE